MKLYRLRNGLNVCATLLFGAFLLTVAVTASATDYFTLEQAQAAMLPGETLTRVALKLDDKTRSDMEDRSGVHEPFDESRVWKSNTGRYFIVDDVVGKHEKIRYAMVLEPSGAVKEIEIMTYRESYGSEIRRPEWRSQFYGKTSKDQLRLGNDIQGISGATLSSKHIAQGVKRVLALYDLALSKL